MLLAADLSASESARRVYLIAGGLVALGVGLLVLTIWFWRTTRPEPEALGPLEVMGDRRFARLDGEARRRALDGVRPTAAATGGDQPGLEPAAAVHDGPIGVDQRDDRRVDQRGVAPVDDDTVATPAPPAAGIDPLLVRADPDEPAPAPLVDSGAPHIRPPHIRPLGQAVVNDGG